MNKVIDSKKCLDTIEKWANGDSSIEYPEVYVAISNCNKVGCVIGEKPLIMLLNMINSYERAVFRNAIVFVPTICKALQENASDTVLNILKSIKSRIEEYGYFSGHNTDLALKAVDAIDEVIERCS